ncbi:hypothetical protein KP509_02G029200 [Ceratopteris richardii]|uniref:ubiquitinyl hydrolase 1 n=1 Tax=Ceratopteris richardii TaxID=49495 RepID=A0A8T2V7V5_CERRI|nr:hypothetical protein KP509_02G029200 [Ceratopteris richardii]
MAGSGVILYHEVQESKLCGVHCVNTVLQGPFFSELDLAAMATELDQKERQIVMDTGGSCASSDYARLVGEGSSNVSLDGNFSIQVLAKALDVWDLRVTSLDAREAETAKANPHQETAFICHLHDHWFTIRKVGGEWYNFNSLFPAPEHLSNFYLSAFLSSLQSEGWSIFVVRGNFPVECAFTAEVGSGFGQWLTPEDAERISRSTKASSKMSGEKDPMLMAAIKASLEEDSFGSQASDQNINSIAAAMAASLANIHVPGTNQKRTT